MSGSAADAGLVIRPGMDVYNADQSRYIGSVVRVWYRESPPSGGAARPEQGQAAESVGLVHEEGAVAGHARSQGQRTLGEEMGPVPTIALGNRGPINQSAAREYATGSSAARPEVLSFAVRRGRIDLGPLSPRIYVPRTAVRSISMERIVLDLEGESIPAAWRRPSAG